MRKERLVGGIFGAALFLSLMAAVPSKQVFAADCYQGQIAGRVHADGEWHAFIVFSVDPDDTYKVSGGPWWLKVEGLDPWPGMPRSNGYLQAGVPWPDPMVEKWRLPDPAKYWACKV